MVSTGYINIKNIHLPTTLGMKPVEVWLLSNLSYPVLVILVNVVLHVTKRNLMLTNHFINFVESRKEE